jgi:hypothetical protein
LIVEAAVAGESSNIEPIAFASAIRTFGEQGEMMVRAFIKNQEILGETAETVFHAKRAGAEVFGDDTSCDFLTPDQNRTASTQSFVGLLVKGSTDLDRETWCLLA